MTVIRDAVIRIRTERSGSVGGGYESRAFAAEARAAREAATAIEGANQGLDRHTRNVEGFGVKSLKAYAQAGQGALQLGRSIALLALSKEQDAQKIIQGLVGIEAAVQAVSGAYKLLSSTAIVSLAASLNPVTASLLAIGTVLVATTAAWDYWGESAQDAANRATQAGINSQKTYQNILATIQQIRQAEMDRRMADEGFAVANAITPEARRIALQNRRTSLEGEFTANERRRTGLEAVDVSRADRPTQAAHYRILADTEKTTLGLLNEKAQVERDLLELRKQERQEALLQQQGFGRSISDLFGGAAGSAVSDLAQRTADADMKRFEQEAQTMINKYSALFAIVNENLERHERNQRSLER